MYVIGFKSKLGKIRVYVVTIDTGISLKAIPTFIIDIDLLTKSIPTMLVGIRHRLEEITTKMKLTPTVCVAIVILLIKAISGGISIVKVDTYFPKLIPKKIK